MGYEKGSLQCPRCSSEFPSYCALLGGGKCCTTDADVKCLGDDKSPDVVCSSVDWNRGVHNRKKCPKHGTRWCELIGECVHGWYACPECRNDKHKWCPFEDSSSANIDGKCCNICGDDSTISSASFLKKVAIGNEIGINPNGLPQTYKADSNSASKKDGSACFNPSGYNMGVSSEKKCHSASSGMRWCDSIGECVRGTTCPECPNDKHMWCKDTKSCCEYDCEATPSPISSGACFNPIGYNQGEANSEECGSVASTGLKYCEATGECIRGTTCPECASDKHVWCDARNACCDYDCEEKNDCIGVYEKSDCNSKYPYFEQLMGGGRCCTNPV